MSRPNIVYRGVVWTARGLYAVMRWPIRVTDAHLLPATGPAVVVANHVSHIDPLHLGVTITRLGRWVAFLGKREVFQHPLVGPLLRATGQIEVDRGGDASRAMAPAVEVLQRGDVVAVFPEGTISRSFVPCPPRLGAARMALATGAPIVPVALWGGQRVITKGRSTLRFPFRRARGVVMTVRFGAPVLPEPGEDAGRLMARAWEAVGHLVERSAADYPVVPEEGEDAWWLPAHRGGSAPTVIEALEARTAEARERQLRRAAELPVTEEL